jgi:hypothetical protein
MGHVLRHPASVEPVEQEFLIPRARAVERRPGRVPDRAILERIRAEFTNEMCGFYPTSRQAARLFGLSNDDCQRVLDSLAHEGFLQLGEDGRYRAR